MSFDLLIFVKHDVDVVMYMWFNLTLLTVFASDGQSNVNEDSWQERWCELSQLPQGPPRNKSSEWEKLMEHWDWWGNYTWEQVVFKWMGNQIGNGSNVRFGSFVAKLVFFAASSLRDEGFSILACIVQTKIGSDKTDGNSKSLAYRYGGVRNYCCFLFFFFFRNICAFYPAGYLCSKNISREALNKTSKNITISQLPTSQLQNT